MGTRNNNDHRGRQQEKKRPNSAIEKFIIVLSRLIEKKGINMKPLKVRDL